jgi:hypothetical protein
MSQPWTHISPHSPAYPRINEHYVEPHWVSERLFQEEDFIGGIYDPACGFGRIVTSALNAGYEDAYGSDIVDRGFGYVRDFFQHVKTHDNIISNPPFDVFEDFAQHALKRAVQKIALIMPTARLNAARWLEDTPLQTVWLLTPRPSMPPGHVITSGGKVGGGKSDYCWLVFNHKYIGQPELRWLHRATP